MNNTNSPIELESPITVVISRRVKKGNEAKFEELSSRMTETAASFPGHRGAFMLRPVPPMTRNTGLSSSSILRNIWITGSAQTSGHNASLK